MALLEDIKKKMKQPINIPTGQELKQKIGEGADKIKQEGYKVRK